MDPCLEKHIFEISTGLFAELRPINGGVTQAPFFEPGSKSLAIPSTETRVVNVPLPDALTSFYSKFPSNVEFSTEASWVFMSEDEITVRYATFFEKGQTRVIDFALCYAGMGHVQTCAFDPVTNTVFTTFDGGSNGFDRASNFQAKVDLDVDSQLRKSFEDWWREQTSSSSADT